MVRITEDLLRRKAEANNGVLRTLRELALHQQGIETIELLNQHCRHLRVLYLHNNIISKIEGLHRLKELEHLNLAINNITVIQGLSKCESLRKLDLTLNFISVSALPSVASLEPCYSLRELHLLGNPCEKWEGYRGYIIACLTQLTSLDGEEISHEERKHALLHFTDLGKELGKLQDPTLNQNNKIVEATPKHFLAASQNKGSLAELCQPWCPETRVQDQREAEERQEASKRAAATAEARLTLPDQFVWRYRPLRECFPDIDDDEENALQCNEGDWEFSLYEEELNTPHKSGGNNVNQLVLTLTLEPHLDVQTVKLDVRPKLVRLLANKRLFQLRLPYEVNTSEATAQRSRATGRLVIRMPLENGKVSVKHRTAHKKVGSMNVNKPGFEVMTKPGLLNELHQLTGAKPAAIVIAEEEHIDDDDHYLPPLRF